MKNIHILPTDKPSRLLVRNDKPFVLMLQEHSPFATNDTHTNKNIYITSDEEIKEVDWIYNEYQKTIYKFCVGNGIGLCKKIILTTDTDLIKDGVQAIDDEFLEWFVKNPSCDEVKIESWQTKGEWDLDYKIIIPKEEPKQETTLEEVMTKNGYHDRESDYLWREGVKFGAKWQQERMYSEEDLRNAYRWGTTVNQGTKEHFNELIEQFKKK